MKHLVIIFHTLLRRVVQFTFTLVVLYRKEFIFINIEKSKNQSSTKKKKVSKFKKLVLHPNVEEQKVIMVNNSLKVKDKQRIRKDDEKEDSDDSKA